MSEATFQTVRTAAEATVEEKRSVFIAACRRVESEAEAEAFLRERRRAHPDARHTVHAFLLRDGKCRFSDDGEPQGSSGAPTLEIIRRARAAGVRTPIIVLSARGSVEAKVTGLEAGGDDYLAKPFSITELIARVQALLRRASATPEATALREADLEVDVVTHRVTRAGRRIDLQPLEYQLLEYLMRNKGRVVSKTTIMERVWDYAFDPHTNVVEVRVSRLRSKITAPGERELIHTIRRFGYVLEAR